MYIHDNLSINSSQNEKGLGQKVVEKKHTLYVQCISSENHAICEIIWKNMVQRDR